ncbi:unnamed protein product [Periconia digitata]|uniref:Uncharacterized protein n=1 Tax=Periconia digitata TaxID=1303443 RepID=A0A9W4UCS1_9PLEO|nr:unnamed protein product [Periconia digitata]
MPRTTFPSLTEFLSKMEPGKPGDGGSTDNWDVVVSYSLDKLNELLGKLWKTDAPFKSTISTQTNEYYMMLGTTYTVNWEMTLGSPSLSFDPYGDNATAVLTMLVNGWYQVADQLDSEGKVIKTFDKKPFPVDQLVLKAAVPLAMVKADTLTSDLIITGGSKSVTFIDKPGQKAYVVFNFAHEGIGAQYSVEAINPATETPDLTNLSTKLSKWIRDQNKVPSIKCALAEVTAETQPAIYCLTPQSCAFSIYAPQNAGDGHQNAGCLSVYINTKETGNEPGADIRSFKFPSNEEETYPIPLNYTASIIIRHRVFAEAFFIKSLKDLRNSDGKQLLFHKVILKDSNKGLALNCFINRSAAAEWSDKSLFGLLTRTSYTHSLIYLTLKYMSFTKHILISKIEQKLDFGSDYYPVELTIEGNNAHWYYNFYENLKWIDLPTWGTVTYRVWLDKRQQVFTSANDEGVQAHMQLESKDWTTFHHGDDPETKEWLLGKRQEIPKDSVKELDSIAMPTVDSYAGLRYFSTTNVFAPGRHMLKVDDVSAVHLPYDLVILGNLVSPETVSPSPPPAVAGVVRAMANATKPINIKSNDEYRKDMLLGKPILLETMDVLSRCDEKEVTQFIQGGSGYNIDPSDSMKFAEKNSDTTSTEFDLSQFGGMYKFTEPASLATAVMMIDSSNSRLYVGGSWVHNRTTDDGSIAFTYDNYKYSLRFSLSRSESGDELILSFNGTRQETGKTVSETVKGKQDDKPPSDETIAETPSGVNAAYVISGFGAGWLVLSFVLDRFYFPWRKEKAEKAKEKIAEQKEGLKKAVDILEKNVAYPQISPKKFSTAVESHVKSKLQELMRKDPPPDLAELHKLAASEAVKELRSKFITAVDPYFRVRMHAVEGILTPAGITAHSQTFAATLMNSNTQLMDNLKEGSDYIKSLTAVEVSRKKVEEHRAAKKSQETLKDKYEMARANLDVQLKEDYKERAELVERLRKQGLVEADIKSHEEVKSLDTQINDRVREIKNEANKRDAAETGEKAEQKNIKDAELEEKRRKKEHDKERDRAWEI